jgi:hypothetical protein
MSRRPARTETTCLHFVGFGDPRVTKDARYSRAQAVFGHPDFLHPGWDLRARREIADGDTIVFANGPADQAPRIKSYSDCEGA